MPGTLITADALDGLLAVTPLQSARETAVVTNSVSTDKVMAMMPHAVSVLLTVIECTAAHTLDIKVQGRNLSTDAYTDVAIFAQVTNANQANQRLNIAQPYKRYRTSRSTTGAFGAGQFVTYSLTLIGTRCKFAPITQVD
jgi:hypothetical protein